MQKYYSCFYLLLGLLVSIGLSAKPSIVYDSGYNISFGGIEKLLGHSFDTHKYGRVFDYLTKQGCLQKVEVHKPTPATEADLLQVHTKRYLESLKTSDTVSRVAELIPLKFIPNGLLQWRLLTPLKLATGGTVMAAQLAHANGGLAINIGGGFHHAKENNGEGFCFFADIPLAMKKLWEKDPALKIMVIDLDAHQGNGVSNILYKETRATIVDAYTAGIYPNNPIDCMGVQYKVPLKPYTKDEEYLQKVKATVNKAIAETKPQFIIYNAGTDIYEKDPLGAQSVSAQGIIERDAFIVSTAKQHNIPAVMVLSGGYTAESANIIGKSIENILAQE